MASIRKTTPVTPLCIDKFLGLNLSNTGDTQIKLGESGNMTNFYITDDYKLKKMYGYRHILKFTKRDSSAKIQGMFEAKLKGTNYLLVAAAGYLYAIAENEIYKDFGKNVINVGSISDAPTSFFVFDKKVYILNGNEYKSWDGETFQDVAGYIPKVMISTSFDGSGTPFEDINLLTGKKHQTFNSDGNYVGVSLDLQLAEKNIDSVDKVIVEGRELTPDQYTVDKTEGKITFVGNDGKPKSEGMDTIDVYWTKGNGDRSFIEKMKAGIIFGGGVDTRVFLYGNEEEPNRIRYSAVANNVPSVEYFPAVNQIDIGASNFSVTDLRRHYDRLLITTNKPEAYYMTLDTMDLNTGEEYSTTVTSPATFPLNEVHGNIAFNQGQVIDNDPVTIDKDSIIRWKSTNVRDERNMKDISQKIKLDLVDLDLTKAKTLDLQCDNQLWIAIGEKIYIYNYMNDTYSKVVLPVEIDNIVKLNNNVIISTPDGDIFRFDKDCRTFYNETIKAHWDMNFYDFEAPYLRKTMYRLWVLLQPQMKSSLEIGYESNRNTTPITKRIEYKMTYFDDLNFDDFSFNIKQNPQPFRLKIKAKKFTNLKILLDNNEESDATVLELALKTEYGGESK